jgi:thioredoxin 1
VVIRVGEGGNSPRCINFAYAIYSGWTEMWELGFCHNAATLAVSETPKGKPMASDLIKHVTDASFEADVLQATQPTLVDYWAEWCGPCKMIAPILDEVSTSYAGKLQIAKMNVDENRDIPAKFGIRGIPTLMLFKDGQLAATKVGAMSKAQMTAFIDEQLAAR